MRRNLVAGNWKMNGSGETLAGLAELSRTNQSPTCDIAICPPFPLLPAGATALSGGHIALGAQDCHAAFSGAHTGDVSAQMLAEAGCDYVIVGHSERRAAYGETDANVAAKATAATGAGLQPIICLGETIDQRQSGLALDVVSEQLKGSVPETEDASRLVVAYEPVWAIGTGEVATVTQIAEVHDVLRANLLDRFGARAEQIRLLYGGSVKANNAKDIFAVANVDGALVGGASLQPSDFQPIIDAAT